MVWQAKWIWLKDEPESSINLRVLARKTFTLGDFDRAELAVTADTQYRLFVNGKWVNDGPTRAFPWKYSFDRIDVSKFLKPGKNVLAVWVQHHGEGTFHSLVTRPGLLAQLDIHTGKSVRTLGSDASWKMLIDPAHERWTPRISCQMPCEEQYDARDEVLGWCSPDFNDAKWPGAKVVASVENGPWQNLTEREIPLFAVEKVNPVRVLSARTVRTPNFVAGINVKRAFWPERIDANHRDYRGAVLTGLISPVDQEIRIFRQLAGVSNAIVFVNGIRVEYAGPEYLAAGYLARTAAKVKLKKGMNVVLAILDCRNHYDDFHLIMDVEKEVHLKSPVGKGHWSVAGPFEQGGADWENLKTAKTLDDLEKNNLLRYFCQPPGIALTSTDANAVMMYAEPVDGPVKTQALDNILADNNELAVVDQHKEDVEFLIDFGCEYNAHVEFNLSAPEGVIVDVHCFEEIVDGKLKLACGNRSGFRYVTRAGWQKYTTFRHFGFRYITLTFRNVTAPITIRNVSAFFVHHQVEHHGQFQCNDYLLNRIWEVGKQTLLCCMEDTFTDCPTYEQTYWVGDGRNEALTCHTTFGQYDITRRCARLPGWSLHRSDLTESQVPSAWQNIIPVWSFLWVRMIWEHYQFTGDTSLLREMYPCVKKMLSNIRDKYLDSATGLFTISGDGVWNFFDWTPIDLSSCIAFNNIFLVDSLQLARQMSQVLGRKSESTDWKKWADDLTRRINRYFWSEKLGAYADCIRDDGQLSTIASRPTNTLALLYDIAPADRAQKILPIVLGKQTKDIIPFGSPFAYFYLLECYVKLGRFDLITQMIRAEWGRMLDHGATTFWETLQNTRSNCHAWSAAPTYFLSRDILGVHPASPGFGTTLIAPLTLDLKWAKGTIPTPGGDIHIHWEKSKTEFKIQIEKPAGLAAKLQLPQELQAACVTIGARKLGRVKSGDIINLPRIGKLTVTASLKA